MARQEQPDIFLDRDRAEDPRSSLELPDYVRTVVQAERLESSAIGYAAVKSPLYQAFEQTMAQGKTLYPQLEAIYPKATPAGKLYLVQVIQSINPTTGQQLLRQLATDSTPVTTINGCLLTDTTVSQVAQTLFTAKSARNRISQHQPQTIQF